MKVKLGYIDGTLASTALKVNWGVDIPIPLPFHPKVLGLY
jgi:hypothetical protein